MLDVFLVPEITVEADGESAPVSLGSDAGKLFLLTLAITRIVEQEALDVSIWGSADGQDWSNKPLTSFPQKFYTGLYELLLDLSNQPEVRHLKAKWVVGRWGVGPPTPHFSFLVKLQEAGAGARVA